MWEYCLMTDTTLLRTWDTIKSMWPEKEGTGMTFPVHLLNVTELFLLKHLSIVKSQQDSTFGGNIIIDSDHHYAFMDQRNSHESGLLLAICAHSMKKNLITEECCTSKLHFREQNVVPEELPVASMDVNNKGDIWNRGEEAITHHVLHWSPIYLKHWSKMMQRDFVRWKMDWTKASPREVVLGM